MPRPCSVCSHERRSEIDSDLRSGTSLRNATKKFGLTTSALFRHKAEHLGSKKAAQAEADLSRGTRARVKNERKLIVPERALTVPERVSKRAKEPAATEGDAAKVTVEEVPEEGEFDDVEWAGWKGGRGTSAPREARVRIVMGLKAAGRWETGTGPKLAATWGISTSSMERIAAEASRRVKACGDAAYVRTRLVVALDEGIAAAHGDDLKCLAPLVKAYAELADIVGPKRHEISGPGGVPLGTPAGLARLYERAIAGDLEAEQMLERFAEHGSRALVPEIVEVVEVQPSASEPAAPPIAPAVDAVVEAAATPETSAAAETDGDGEPPDTSGAP